MVLAAARGQVLDVARVRVGENSSPQDSDLEALEPPPACCCAQGLERQSSLRQGTCCW